MDPRQGCRMEQVTNESLMEAIRRAMAGGAGPTDAMTIQEMGRWIADDTGASVEYTIRKIREALPRLRESGVLELVTVPRLSVDDRRIVVKAFRFKGA